MRFGGLFGGFVLCNVVHRHRFDFGDGGAFVLGFAFPVEFGRDVGWICVARGSLDEVGGKTAVEVVAAFEFSLDGDGERAGGTFVENGFAIGVDAARVARFPFGVVFALELIEVFVLPSRFGDGEIDHEFVVIGKF